MKNAVVSAINNLDKEIYENYINQHTQKHTPLDTCLKWAPFAILLACDALGVKTKNTYKQHIVMVVGGNLLLNAAIQPLKKSINRIRPNGSANSFPSAHTATGFLTSEIIHQELKENIPVLAHSGYAISIVTGWLRLYHNKHWFSDIVGGALIGALVGTISCNLLSSVEQK